MKGPVAGATARPAVGLQPAEGSHARGVMFTLAGVICWSLGGVLVRLTDGIDAWQIVFYRSVILLVVMGAWVLGRHRAATLAAVRDAGWNAVFAGIAAGLAGVSFVVALFFTTVAQAGFMVGIAPFCAALLGWWILRERVQPATWAGMVIALVGLAVMLAGGRGSGTVIGSLLALYAAFCFSCYSILLRWGQNTDMTVAQIWNALFLIVFAGAVLLLPTPLRGGHGLEALAIGWSNLPVVLVMGVVQLSLGMILFTRGSRTVPAAELSLIALAEPALAPIWTWLAVGEVPVLATIIGGVFIMSAIAIQVLLSNRR